MYSLRIVSSLLILIALAGCVRLEKVADGDTAFARKRYSQAIAFYERDFQRAGQDEDRSRLAFRLGRCYEQNGDYVKAASWYKQAYEAGCRTTCLEKYAEMMSALEQYDQAIKAYERLSASGNRAQYLAKISDARNAMIWQRRKESGLVVNTISSNTRNTEYPVQLIGADILLVSGDKDVSDEDKKYYWTGNSFFDSWMRSLDRSAVEETPKAPYSDFDGNQADHVVYDQLAFCTRCFADENYEYDDYCKILVSSAEGGYWTDFEVLPFVEPGRNYRHPSYDPVTSTLYFSANLEDDTSDINIYVSQYSPDNTWSLPEKMQGVNTKVGREVFPRIYGDTLFFSSDAAGMGGLDIFYVSRRGGRWSAPQNLLPPINSGGDDFGMTLYSQKDAEGALGYFASSRRGGKGRDDIYSFEVEKLLRPQEEREELEPDTVSVLVLVQQKVYNTPDVISSGLKLREPLPSAKLHIETFPALILDTLSDRYGKFVMQVEANSVFAVSATKEGYLLSSAEVLLGDRDTTIRLALDKILYDQEYILENIYFDFDKWDIREDAKPALDDLVKLLQNNPDIRIELSSHTDCQGTIGYNQTLSERRAFSSVRYLIDNGIAADRLLAKGYGETKPLVDCECDDCTDADNQLNRRTSFRILR